MYLNNIYTFCCSPWSSHVWPGQLEPYETNVISELLRPACGKLEQRAGFYYSDTQYIRLGFARYVLAIQGRIKLHCGTVLWDEFWLSLPCNLWGCARDRIEMVVKVHSGTVLGDALQCIFNMAANSSPKTVWECTLTTILIWSLSQPQSGE